MIVDSLRQCYQRTWQRYDAAIHALERYGLDWRHADDDVREFLAAAERLQTEAAHLTPGLRFADPAWQLENIQTVARSHAAYDRLQNRGANQTRDVVAALQRRRRVEAHQRSAFILRGLRVPARRRD